jgi:hypothetical protein
MNIETPRREVESLQKSSGVFYRIVLDGVLKRYGRQPVAEAIAAHWSATGGNVTSIATAADWCRPVDRLTRKPPPDGPDARPAA